MNTQNSLEAARNSHALADVEAYVSYLPLGPILGIMPWNFPMWQTTRMGIPALLAANALLIKHSPNTQRSSLELERMMLEAGFPKWAFQNMILKTEDVVNVIDDKRVQGTSLTGSVCAGSAVASEAGAVIKKTVMEFGGSDAFIVLEDADTQKGRELSHFGPRAFVMHKLSGSRTL
jgi:acyl-CoA reductase-like NAD-dependent aldehyde dehydrogenase